MKKQIYGLVILVVSTNVSALCGANFTSCPQECDANSCIERKTAVPPHSTRSICVNAPVDVDIVDVGWGLYINPNQMGGSWWQYKNFVSEVNGSNRHFCIAGVNDSDYGRGMYLRVWFSDDSD